MLKSIFRSNYLATLVALSSLAPFRVPGSGSLAALVNRSVCSAGAGAGFSQDFLHSFPAFDSNPFPLFCGNVRVCIIPIPAVRRPLLPFIAFFHHQTQRNDAADGLDMKTNAMSWENSPDDVDGLESAIYGRVRRSRRSGKAKTQRRVRSHFKRIRFFHPSQMTISLDVDAVRLRPGHGNDRKIYGRTRRMALKTRPSCKRRRAAAAAHSQQF